MIIKRVTGRSWSGEADRRIIRPLGLRDGVFAIPLSCGGRYWGHGGDIAGFSTRDGFTEDGRRGVVVSMSTQFQNAKDLAKRQSDAASTLIDHALCQNG